MHNQSEMKTSVISFAEILNLSAADKEKFGLIHTPREIFQQPETWLTTFQIFRENQSAIFEFLNQSGINQFDKEKVAVLLIGAGTSDYVGRALTALLKKKWKCPVEAVPSTDLLTEMDDMLCGYPDDTKHLWISFSRSGDSFEGVKVIQKALAQYPQIRHLIVTCNRNGKMANEICAKNSGTLCLTLDQKVNDLGLAMTSSFTNMIVAGQCLANFENLADYCSTIENLAATAAAAMPEIARLAEKIAALDFRRICFLGSGALKSVGAESALKVMELTAGYFSVMTESFLGLRHGPLSWLNDESLVVGFISNDSTKAKVEIELIKEVIGKKAAKATLAIVPQENFDVQTDYKLSLNISPALDDFYRPPLDILFAQYLGLFASLRQGLKPDTPSSDGKIQRVVSKIGGF